MSSQVQPHQVSAGSLSVGRLKAVVLLAGIVRKESFADAIRRSKLDLPIETGRTVLDHWHSEISDLAEAANVHDLRVRVMVNKEGTSPRLGSLNGKVQLGVEHDLVELRGTAGLLRDLGVDYDDEDVLLVGNAYQVLVQPLTHIVEVLSRRFEDVSLVSHRDGTPSGLMLLKCRCLRSVSPVGFVDLKEQALPEIAKSHSVSVVHSDRPTGFPIKHRGDYIQALRRYHRWRKTAGERDADLYGEDWKQLFSIKEKGAAVGDGARIHDSVVLQGARVESGATLVRSVICPGAVVGRGATVVDRQVTAA